MAGERSIMREVLRAVRAEGFKKPEDWICFYFTMGYSLYDLYYHFQWTRNFYCSYHGFYNNTHVFVGEVYSTNKKYRPAVRRAFYTMSRSKIGRHIRELRGELAYSYSITDAFLKLEKYGFTRRQIRRLFKSMNRRKRKTKEGFTQIEAYEKWTRIAKELGYKSFSAAIKDLKKQGKNVNTIAKMFNTSFPQIAYRIEQLSNKAKN